MKKQEDFQRRRPRQARAQATYDSILEAAVQILQRVGADGLNTNRVAERAGVSIGTLYQYFPDKDAILLAAARRELSKPDADAAALPKALMEALVRALETLLGRGAARQSLRTLRVPPKRGRNAGANGIASVVEEFVYRWVMPPRFVHATMPAVSRRPSR